MMAERLQILYHQRCSRCSVPTVRISEQGERILLLQIFCGLGKR